MTSLRELSHGGAVRECLLTQLTPRQTTTPSSIPRASPPTRAAPSDDSDSPFLLGFSSGFFRSLRPERAVRSFATFRGLLLLLAPPSRG